MKIKERLDESKEAHSEGVAHVAKMRAYRRIDEIRSRPV